ncbi:phosphoribosylanthranilate isomerase [Cryomorpha ignava]|uniref:N-(5'-phosphoribosyl)anthranilate isomerase n=1 Tax=Cryomorpha ignava TaxID=101383 RepID=A0A7K3WT87_9FLAO|nr:phosphoribosylanthranilate isomerase [Cryomorpha ignava]NEN24900.1 phosphoribosylanthranilate isomerase [Cryomorpha ignava]
MKTKICGLREKENIAAISGLKPDFLGFIFYEKSPRYVGKDFSVEAFSSLPSEIEKVGVFVNENVENVTAICRKFGFGFAQLHGDESPAFCQELAQNDIKIMKAFPIDGSFDFSVTEAYAGTCSYFLFDTKVEGFGGSGKSFNWSILEQYTGSTPFLLSGGLGLENITQSMKIQHPMLAGYDLNSKLETSPGVKDYEKVKTILNTIRKHAII